MDRAPEKPSYKTVMDGTKQQQYKYDKFEKVTEIIKLGKTELKKYFHHQDVIVDIGATGSCGDKN